MNENEILEFIFEHDWNDTSLVGILDEEDIQNLGVNHGNETQTISGGNDAE